MQVLNRLFLDTEKRTFKLEQSKAISNHQIMSTYLLTYLCCTKNTNVGFMIAVLINSILVLLLLVYKRSTNSMQSVVSGVFIFQNVRFLAAMSGKADINAQIAPVTTCLYYKLQA